jgi:orotate phosphoribosyltransferase
MKTSIDFKVLEKLREIISLKLWENSAIKIDFDNPFKLVSGKLSPIYINCRLMISDPFFMDLFSITSKLILKNIKFDVIAGGETAGIPFASFLANSFNKPLIYIRKKRKDYGIGSLIEGSIKKGEVVLLVEDLITDAGSKLHFVNEIRKTNNIISNILVLFDREQGGKEILKKEKIDLMPITNIYELIETGLKNDFINELQYKSINNYINNPKI